MRHGRTLAWLFVCLAACSGSSGPPPEVPHEPRRVVLSVIGTNDLHGHLRALPWFGGYVEVLRELREDDGGVLLIDGGDMFQGTLESNLQEGAPIVEAYGVLGYDAVTIGNHEFDYGPVGEHATPQDEDDDPRGALLARAAQAGFPFLNANLLAEATGERVDWEHVTASVLLPKAGVVVGVIGVTTEDTLTTTLAANVADLRMSPIVREVTREAASLRRRGADVIVLAAHAGGICHEFTDPADISSCEHGQEIFAVAEALPTGTLDAIVAGHTHQGVAHYVNGIPVIESYSYGEAFGRIDLVIEDGRVVTSHVYPPQQLCETGTCSEGNCVPMPYEGRTITPVAEVAAVVDPAIAHAAEFSQRQLQVELAEAITKTRVEECPLGNLFVDLMRGSREGVDVALTNGGGLRADLPAGPLTYGRLYEAMPFDNRFAVVRMTAGELRAVVAANLQDDGSFFSLSGVTAEAACEGGALNVTLRREGSREPLADDAELVMLTTDFLATGGDGLLEHLTSASESVELDEGEMVRDAMARVLTERGGTLRARDLYDPTSPRVRYEGERPLSCPP